MANPKYHYTGTSIAGQDDSGNYADETGHVLEFRDARSPQPAGENFVTFVAFLTSFSQAFSSNWNEEEVYGRMDPIATFKNTTRTISVAWDLPSSSKDDASQNLERCNQLINLVYPSYAHQVGSNKNALAMSKPPLIRLKYANLIARDSDNQGLLGYITSINWSPVTDMGYFHAWSPASEAAIFPKVISLSVEFKVLHERTLGYDEDGKPIGARGWVDEHQFNWPFKDGNSGVE